METNEVAHYEPPHLDLCCLPVQTVFFFFFFGTLWVNGKIKQLGETWRWRCTMECVCALQGAIWPISNSSNWKLSSVFHHIDLIVSPVFISIWFLSPWWDAYLYKLHWNNVAMDRTKLLLLWFFLNVVVLQLSIHFWLNCSNYLGWQCDQLLVKSCPLVLYL